MKKLIFTILTFLVVQYSHAQVSIGAALGVSISKSSRTIYDTDYRNKSISGIPLSLIAEFNMGSSLRISTGLSFIKKGVASREDFSNGGFDQSTFQLNYLEIPATLKVYFNKSKLRIYALGGIYAGIITAAKIKSETVDGTYKSKSTKDMDRGVYDISTNPDLGIKTGVGIEYKFKFGNLFLSPTYHIGLSDADTDPSDFWRHRVMIFNVGYLYTFNKTKTQSKN